MGVKGALDLTTGQRRIVLELIERHLPDTDVWAYGSRVAWTSRPESDLDLVVFSGADQSGQVSDLREALEESELPFRVDVLVWDELPESFQKKIADGHVPLSIAPVLSAHNTTTWRYLAIEDIAEVVGGGTPPTADESNFGGRIPWLTPRDLSRPHDRRVSQGSRNLTAVGLRNCSARLLPPDAVLLSTRAPVGYTAISKNPIATNQGFKSLIPTNDVISEYLYYWLTANVPLLEAHATGSTYPELPARFLTKIQIAVPPVPIQRRVVDVLGRLDDKIELNRRMNATLQDTFRTVFERLLTYSETEGSAGRISDIASAGGQLVDPQTLPADTPYIGLEHMPRSSIALADWGCTSDVTSNKLTFRRSDLLFGKLRPYFRKVGTPPVDGVCSTDIIVVVPKHQYWHAFVLGHISSREFCSYASQQATGTKMPRTHWSVLKQYPVSIPAESSARRFQDVVGGILDLLSANIHEALHLAELRTTLSTAFFGNLDRSQTSLEISMASTK